MKESAIYPQVKRLSKGRWGTVEREVVHEFPLKLVVNQQELATLICTPDQLNYLVVGFLHLQGLARSLDEVLMLGICDDFGVANVRIAGEVPTGLKPTLTTGCGAGVTFNLEDEPEILKARIAAQNRQRFAPSAILSLMESMYAHAEKFKRHRGIHSSALGDGKKMLVLAEDIGRHNTVDRIAGEALFKDIDLGGKMIVTSGRISSEMVAKSAQLGIGLIGSRKCPTDMGIKLAEDLGITLVGYVRNGSMEVFCDPHGLVDTVSEVVLEVTEKDIILGPIEGVTANPFKAKTTKAQDGLVGDKSASLNGSRPEVAEMTFKQFSSAFWEACTKGSLADVNFLVHLACGEEPNLQVWSRGLFLAAEHGHLPVVRRLVEEALILQRVTPADLGTGPAVEVALRFGHSVIVEYLTDYVPKLLERLKPLNK